MNGSLGESKQDKKGALAINGSLSKLFFERLRMPEGRHNGGTSETCKNPVTEARHLQNRIESSESINHEACQPGSLSPFEQGALTVQKNEKPLATKLFPPTVPIGLRSMMEKKLEKKAADKVPKWRSTGGCSFSLSDD